jgi:DNA-binding transcriptional MocR family regulator
MSAGVTFERVYHALKDQLGSGRFAAGAHLEPAALSRDLNASITPVRDALHRLAGEGLVETPRGDGFRTPPMTEVGLRHLYRWNAALLGLALRSQGARIVLAQPGEGEPGPIERLEHLFLAIAVGPGNPEQTAATARMNERLRPVRQAELEVLAGCAAEIDELVAWAADQAVMPLRRAIAAFHRRRERQVGEIVAALVAPR